MGEHFLTWDLTDILVGEPIPGTLYLYLDFRFVTFRAAGDTIDRLTYDRLEFKKVKNLFIVEEDRKKFHDWLGQRRMQEKEIPVEAANRGFAKAKVDVHRKMLDIFQSEHPDKIVHQAIESSKKLVNEVMKFPYAVKPLGLLQSFSQGTVSHSLNVSVLSTYLAMQMGYSHQLILQHVGMGALLHDIGKPLVRLEDEDSPELVATKMKEHPTLGLRLLEQEGKVPNEVKMIVAQHHELHDGTGYPKNMRGSSIYDLARIVAIANVFDGLVGNASGTLQERQKSAVQKLDQDLYRKFDPQKLEKTLKILKLGL